jgi:hypothetical protein
MGSANVQELGLRLRLRDCAINGVSGLRFGGG